MSVGQSTALAHAILNLIRNTNATGFTPWFKLHTGDPGAAGTGNASLTTTRVQATFAAPSAGSAAAPAISWPAWAVADETITHVSMWDASTAGTFQQSGALSVSKLIQSGDVLNLTITATQGPIAA